MFVAFLAYTIIIIIMIMTIIIIIIIIMIIIIIEKADVTDAPPVAVKLPNHGSLGDENTSSGK